MVDLRLVKVIQSALSSGENINQIRKNLFNKGFPPQRIEESINYMNTSQKQNIPHNHSTKKKIIIFGSIIFLLMLGIIIFFFVFSENAEKVTGPISLGVKITEISERINEGGKINFKYSLINPTTESSEIKVLQEVKDSTGKIISSLSFEETISSNFDRGKFGEIDTSQLSSGDYSLTVTISLNSFSSKTNEYFKILGNPSEFSNESNETQNDTGEYVPPAECEFHSDCDDNNLCTTNSCENNECEIQQISPCCGNGVCESSESPSICSEDCQEAQISSDLTDAEIINLAVEEASTNSGAASQYCASIEHETNKDSCFIRIAYISENSALCSQIIEVDSKDDCYLSLATLDASVCQEIINPIKKVACEAVQ